MHKLLFLPFLFSALSGKTQIAEKPIESKVKKVKLYLNSALETRNGRVQLDAGTHDVVFSGLPYSLVEESIRASGTGNATILSVSARREYLEPGELNPESKLLQDSIKILESTLNLKRGLRDIYASTRQMILSNRVVKGHDNGADPEDVMELADMYRERLKQLDEKDMINDESIDKVNARLIVLRHQLQESSGNPSRMSSEVIVRVKASARTDAQFELEYLTLDAGWEPLYDIRNEGLDKPLVFQFKADVWQKTGADWKSVDLTLSTGDPLESIDKPELKSVLLSYNMPYRDSRSKRQSSNKSSYAVFDKEMQQQSRELQNNVNVDGLSQQQQPGVFRIDQVKGFLDSDAGLSTEFLVNTPYSIPSDGKEYHVDIHEKTITCQYRYKAVPSMEKDGFLTARVAGWDQLNLVQATASIFNQGTFIGRIDLDPNTTDDTLELSLGRDKNVSVQRVPVANKTGKNVSSSSVKETFAYEIKVVNNKSQAIELLIIDRYPLSPLKEVVVDLTESAGADVNKEKGTLTWRLNLNPSEKKVMPISYSVKYPKTMTISNL